MYPINRCPALILALNRTPRVRGRIRYLTLSIRFNKDKRGRGVPLGDKWSTSVNNQLPITTPTANTTLISPYLLTLLL